MPFMIRGGGLLPTAHSHACGFTIHRALQRVEEALLRTITVVGWRKT